MFFFDTLTGTFTLDSDTYDSVTKTYNMGTEHSIKNFNYEYAYNKGIEDAPIKVGRSDMMTGLSNSFNLNSSGKTLYTDCFIFPTSATVYGYEYNSSATGTLTINQDSTDPTKITLTTTGSIRVTEADVYYINRITGAVTKSHIVADSTSNTASVYTILSDYVYGVTVFLIPTNLRTNGYEYNTTANGTITFSQTTPGGVAITVGKSSNIKFVLKSAIVYYLETY